MKAPRTARAYLGTTPLGVSTYTPCQWDFNYAIFCAKCGQIWARVFVDAEFEWHVFTTSCEACGPRYYRDFAGSLCCPGEESMMQNFSGEFWNHELRIQFAYQDWESSKCWS